MASLRSLASVSLLMVVVTGAVLAATPAPAADPQVLASSCSGCHTNDEKLTTAIPKIRGLPETVLADAMRAFRAGQRPATVMDRIAKGFTDDEIKQLAAYFSARK
jgi:cytochrome subunit of sulfide dehydrogenase